MQRHANSPVFKSTVHLADVAAMLGDSITAAQLIGLSEHLLSLTEATLFPFDLPAWDRARERSRTALGAERYDALRHEGASLRPEDWLRLGAQVVDLAEAAERNAGDATP